MKKELADYLNSVKGDTHMESQFKPRRFRNENRWQK